MQPTVVKDALAVVPAVTETECADRVHMSESGNFAETVLNNIVKLDDFQEVQTEKEKPA